MKTLWTPASKNFLDIALFASGSGSLMSKNDLQIFRNSPLSWIVILIRRESASSHPLFRKNLFNQSIKIFAINCRLFKILWKLRFFVFYVICQQTYFKEIIKLMVYLIDFIASVWLNWLPVAGDNSDIVREILGCCITWLKILRYPNNVLFFE